jgi:hypothetical protein
MRLHALLLCWPALVWTPIWLALAGLHWAVIGPAFTAGYQLPLLAVCVALSAIGIAIRLGFGRYGLRAAGTVLPFLIPFARLVILSPARLATIAVIAFGMAAVLNARALSRGTTYKNEDMPGVRVQRA